MVEWPPVLQKSQAKKLWRSESINKRGYKIWNMEHANSSDNRNKIKGKYIMEELLYKVLDQAGERLSYKLNKDALRLAVKYDLDSNLNPDSGNIIEDNRLTILASSIKHLKAILKKGK